MKKEADPFKPTWKKILSDHKLEIILAGAAILLITGFAFAPAFRGGWKIVDSTNAGQFGDFIGGYFGTVFLIVSVALLIGSYRNQRSTNDRAVFESRFFELLQYHRDNTNEIEVDNIKGRRAFVSFIREWRLLVKLVSRAEIKTSLKLSMRERSGLSYFAFFHGSGPNSRRTLVEAAKGKYPDLLVEEVLKDMSSDWGVYKKYIKYESGKLPEREALSLGVVTPDALQPLAYVPFEGHHSRLAHYFRHLFHLVKYAANHAPGNTAQEYVDLVRAQLTTHEQAVLALHAASVEGAWKKEKYLEEFHMIKNIPKGFLDTHEFDVRSVFPNVEYADS